MVTVLHQPAPDESLDQLSNSLRILQKRKGHRATSDDILLAWAGVKFAPDATRILDLGTGKGTVALLMLSVLKQSTVLGVEALAESVDLGRRNIELNGFQGRLSIRQADLREPACLADEAPFSLVTGAPPFMKLGTGVLPQNPQRAAGRFELLGGVRDYYRTAEENLTSDGVAIVLMDGLGTDRNLEAARDAGLHPRLHIGVTPRPDRPPTYSICVATRTPGMLVSSTWSMRAETGPHWSQWYTDVRRSLDLP